MEKAMVGGYQGERKPPRAKRTLQGTQEDDEGGGISPLHGLRGVPISAKRNVALYQNFRSRCLRYLRCLRCLRYLRYPQFLKFKPSKSVIVFEQTQL